jgi:hypothetical protein
MRRLDDDGGVAARSDGQHGAAGERVAARAATAGARSGAVGQQAASAGGLRAAARRRAGGATGVVSDGAD